MREPSTTSSCTRSRTLRSTTSTFPFSARGGCGGSVAAYVMLKMGGRRLSGWSRRSSISMPTRSGGHLDAAEEAQDEFSRCAFSDVHSTRRSASTTSCASPTVPIPRRLPWPWEVELYLPTVAEGCAEEYQQSQGLRSVDPPHWIQTSRRLSCSSNGSAFKAVEVRALQRLAAARRSGSEVGAGSASPSSHRVTSIRGEEIGPRYHFAMLGPCETPRKCCVAMRV